MPKYNIEQWQAVLQKENIFPTPMIYIKPDREFIDYAGKNNYMVLVTVGGTGTQYDDRPTIAIVDSSGYFPDYRPNFYNKTGFFTLTLSCGWLGYPNLPQGNGYVVVQGLKGPDKVTIPPPQAFVAPKPIPWPTGGNTVERYNSSREENLSSKQIGILSLAIAGVFGSLVFLSLRKRTVIN